MSRVCVASTVFRCGEEEEPSVWVCHTAGGLWGGFPSQTWGEILGSKNFTRIKKRLTVKAENNKTSNRKVSGSCWTAWKPWYRLSYDCCIPLEWCWLCVTVCTRVFTCVYFHLTSSGNRAGGQLLEAKDWGGDQGVSQVEDLLQEEGEHFICNAIF